MNAREYLKDLAIMAAGLSAAPLTRDAYLDLIAPCPSDRASETRCKELCEMSSCALTVRGLWVRAGVQHPILLAPYRTGKAVADVVEVAREAGALRSLSSGYIIGPADILVLTGPEHVLTVTLQRGDTIESVDGGQRDGGGFEAILAKTRTLVGDVLGGRQVIEIIDADAIADRWGLVAIAEAAADTDRAPGAA